MVLENIKWFPYEDKKWDFINIVPDDTYSVIDTPTVIRYMSDEVKNYYCKNNFADLHVAIKKVSDQSTCTIAMININRIDEKHGVYYLDQDQQILAWHYGKKEPSPSGALFSHGSWKGRTERIDLPKEWIESVINSNMDEHIPISTLPIKPSGSIDELKGSSHWYALDSLKSWLNEYK